MKKIAELKEKKGRYISVALLGIALATMGFSTVPANSKSAVMISDVACYMFDGNGDNYIASTSKAISKQSGKGVSHLTCKADNVPNSTGGVVQFDAYNNPYDEVTTCTDGLGHVTKDWREVVSASGQATLVCHFKL